MRRFPRANLPLIVCCSALCAALYFYADSCYVRRSRALNGANLVQITETHNRTASPNGTSVRLSTAERTNVFFLKTHKCGSSTIQNILMRFGYSRHLDFVLPEKNNYLGHPARFESKFISPDFLLPNQTFNIFTHHTRYNYSAVKAVMKEDAKFVTILREPSDLFESLYTYYHMERYVKNKTLKDVIKSPKLWPVLKDRNTTRKFGANQMSFDLGYDFETGKPGRDDPVMEFIGELDKEFDLVMITEYMEVSLVLLCELMNWPLEYVVFLQLNARPSTSVVKLSPSERHTLLELNLIDTEVYDYFLAKFKQRVVDFGPDSMKNEVDKLLNLNSDLWRNCVDKPNRNGYAKTLGYDLRNKDFLCFFATQNELAFTDLIRNDQLRRFSVMRKLDALMADTAYRHSSIN